MPNKFYVGQTAVGKGLFAQQKISKGETILQFEGPIINQQQAAQWDMKFYGRLMGNPLQIDRNQYIYIKDPGRITNHSCDPNSGVKDDIWLVAIKDIAKNQEIVWDYSTSMDEDDWTMRCLCGSKRCRGIVKDFQYLPQRLRDYYLKLGIVQKFIAKQYLKEMT